MRPRYLVEFALVYDLHCNLLSGKDMSSELNHRKVSTTKSLFQVVKARDLAIVVAVSHPTMHLAAAKRSLRNNNNLFVVELVLKPIPVRTTHSKWLAYVKRERTSELKGSRLTHVMRTTCDSFFLDRRRQGNEETERLPSNLLERTSLTNQRVADVKRYYYAALASRCATMIDDVGSKLSTIRLQVRYNICVMKGEFRATFEDADDKRTESNKSERVHHRVKAEGPSRLSRSSNKVARMLLPTSALTITSFLRTYSYLDVAKALGNWESGMEISRSSRNGLTGVAILTGHLVRERTWEEKPALVQCTRVTLRHADTLIISSLIPFAFTISAKQTTDDPASDSSNNSKVVRHDTPSFSYSSRQRIRENADYPSVSEILRSGVRYLLEIRAKCVLRNLETRNRLAQRARLAANYLRVEKLT
ncbi:hypothetical protein V1478_011190 [Vespula squamosa]|uniref:Uncharacterized protein n=1 Tax=Vespula squamosa TaxID=30214 RepID=A0ABD2ADT0_VESSQ